MEKMRVVAAGRLSELEKRGELFKNSECPNPAVSNVLTIGKSSISAAKEEASLFLKFEDVSEYVASTRHRKTPSISLCSPKGSLLRRERYQV